MRTLTITLHRIENSGSALQAYGLQHFLKMNGIENEIIDYYPAYEKDNSSFLKRVIRESLFFWDRRAQKRKFEAFVNNYLALTERSYHNYNELLACPPEADIYITGSDQLWNAQFPCGNDPAFYLAFGKEGVRKISYAVSLGRARIPQDNLVLVGQYAHDFEWISLRERSSVEQIIPHVNCEVSYVCDPVLLNPIEEYGGIKAERLVGGPYILVYLAQPVSPDELNGLIAEAKAQYGGMVIQIGSTIKHCDCDRCVRNFSPPEFLSYIYNADYIISNSFHGTVFSLLYKKQFATVLPPENGTRIQELLEAVGLGAHGVGPGSRLPASITEAQHQEAERALEELRRASGNELLARLHVGQARI